MKNIKCKHCNNLRNHWCEKVVDSPDEELLRDCQRFWEKTNADRIRAMSDTELAHFMAERNVNESTVLLLNEEHSLTAIQIEALKHRIYCACLQWLKQPVEDES